MPSWIRNSMIVVFKSGCSPSMRCGEPRIRGDHPAAAVEIGCGCLVWWITIIEYNLKPTCRPHCLNVVGIASPTMTASKTAMAEPARLRKENAESAEAAALQMGELSELLGYSLKRAQLRVFEDFMRCVAPLQLTPAQFSVLLLLDRNPGRNQTEIAATLGILRPNFVAMLDGLESRDLCTRVRSANDRRSHMLALTDKGKAVLARA